MARLTRRQFLKAGAGAGAAALLPAGCAWQATAPDGIVVNDIHSQLNATRVATVAQTRSVDGVQGAIRRARAEGRAVSIAGGRHAMGGQQFGRDTLMLDMTAMNRVLAFDVERGLIEVEAGIEWPELVTYLVESQKGRERQWGIVQKQTGADRLTLGGALAANVHGRGLRYKPMIQDVEAFTLVDGQGAVRRCSRAENTELFRAAIGGYGLFGVVTSVTLRLAPRRKIERVVQVINADQLGPAFERRIAEGYLFGDFQYATDAASGELLRKGVFSCYRPVDPARPMPAQQRELDTEGWRRLLYLSHVNKRRAFEVYADYYLSTSGQLYWSDTHQMSVYLDNYHEALDRQLGATERATEMISEIYVPRDALARFIDDVREDFIRNRVDIIYGTIRLIERDDESVLAWARQPWACVIFNLHTVHTPEGLERSAGDFRRLIDHGLRYGGSYYLTYHRWATRRQVEAAYPQFADFLRLKRRVDADERFQSDWYRHYRAMFV
jgi:FAD/FMN-containing dehydrogenase